MEYHTLFVIGAIIIISIFIGMKLLPQSRENFYINTTPSEIDKNFNDFVKSMINKRLYTGYQDIQNVGNLQSSTDLPVNTQEVSLLHNLFVNLLNNNVSKGVNSYTIINVPNIKNTYTITYDNTNNRYIRDYTIPIFLMDSINNYSRRLILTIERIDFVYTKSTIIYVKNVDIPEDTIVDIGKILPYVNTKNTNKIDDYIPHSSGDTNLITQADIDAELKRQQTIQTLKNSYSCFGIPNSANINDQNQCITFGGYWDKEIQDNTECPFYKANKNYTNDRGANIGGYCELPRNMKIEGYRYYDLDPKKSPLCYNCKTDLIGQGSLGFCCDKQNDKSIYPNLKSPDYVYNNDEIDRINASSELTGNGLSLK